MSGQRWRTLVVGSAFRNTSTAQIDRWVRQIRNLHLCMADNHIDVRGVAVEGDSTDDTRQRLIEACTESTHHPAGGVLIDVHQCNHGGPMFGSIESAERMRLLSKVGDAILDAASVDADYVWYVESDLIWEPKVIQDLFYIADTEYSYTIDGAGEAVPPAPVSIIAPLVFAGGHFYDVWGFRGLDGSRFAPFPPYHSSLLEGGDYLKEVSSVGSGLLIRGEVARSIRMGDGALVQWCANARAAGHHIYVAPWLRIEHP